MKIRTKINLSSILFRDEIHLHIQIRIRQLRINLILL